MLREAHAPGIEAVVIGVNSTTHIRYPESADDLIDNREEGPG